MRRMLTNTTWSKTKVHISNVANTTKWENYSSESLALHLSTGWSEGNYLGNVFKGWFIPPETTKYQFWMACDDYCILNLGQAPNNASKEAVKKVIGTTRYTSFRDYFKSDGRNRSSGWYTLEKGKPYYLEAQHSEGTGGDHVSVAVEIE